jgi:hypothetical protein
MSEAPKRPIVFAAIDRVKAAADKRAEAGAELMPMLVRVLKGPNYRWHRRVAGLRNGDLRREAACTR